MLNSATDPQDALLTQGPTSGPRIRSGCPMFLQPRPLAGATDSAMFPESAQKIAAGADFSTGAHLELVAISVGQEDVERPIPRSNDQRLRSLRSLIDPSHLHEHDAKLSEERTEWDALARLSGKSFV